MAEAVVGWMCVYAGSGRGARSVGGCARSARSHLFLERRAWNARAGFSFGKTGKDKMILGD